MIKNKTTILKIKSEINYPNHGLFNVVKSKRFPTCGENGKYKDAPAYSNDSDLYSVYELNKEDIGKFLNTWYVGEIMVSKKGEFIIVDEMIVVKKVNEHTSGHLYHKEYNPITLRIMCPTGAKFKLNEKGEKLYQMKAQIHSIDDSSYGVWCDNKTLDELKLIRIETMKWLNIQKLVDGDEFLNFCVSVGANEDSIDYN